MKRRTKLLSLVLALMMCLGLLPAPAAALSDGTFEYTISDDGVSISGLTNWNVEDMVIPSTIAGKPVISIKSGAFNSIRKKAIIKSVVIPESVKYIEDYAFANNSNLTAVHFSEGLETIGMYAFDDCGLVDVVLPESVTELGKNAFSLNKSMTSIKLPSSLKEIPDSFVVGAKSLSRIEIPNSVTSIGKNAFWGTGLTSIKIPQGVTAIPEDMCRECENLVEVDLPLGITSIGQYAFRSCTSLKTIYLPTTLKTLSFEAFRNSGLEEVILPYGTSKFLLSLRECKNLTAVYAPSTVNEINEIPSGAIVYCMPDSDVKAFCEKRGISCLTDASCDTRINVLYNGRRVSFGAYGQNPTAVNNRTMVPLRSIFEAMGAEVQWEQATQTVTAIRGSTKIVMTLGQNSYTVNGESKTMDTPPMALNSRTMVPVRVVAESFGADVAWHAASATVLITE